MQMNDNQSNQQSDEREIIEKFLQKAGIKIQPNGIQFLNPPSSNKLSSPDVLCNPKARSLPVRESTTGPAHGERAFVPGRRCR